MTKITQATAVAMSTAAAQVRADWDHAGILAALRIEADRGTPCEDVFIALANLCANHEARTPGLLNRPGAWWQKPAGRIARRGDQDIPCPDHVGHVYPCKHPDHGGDMTPEQIAEAARAARANITYGRSPMRVPTPAVTPDLATVRARIDRENE